MSHETQVLRAISVMKRRKVKNYEFSQMHMLSHTRVISTIRQKGFKVEKERIYDKNGKATGVFQYWIPRKRNKYIEHKTDAGVLLEDKKPNFLERLLG